MQAAVESQALNYYDIRDQVLLSEVVPPELTTYITDLGKSLFKTSPLFKEVQTIKTLVLAKEVLHTCVETVMENLDNRNDMQITLREITEVVSNPLNTPFFKPQFDSFLRTSFKAQAIFIALNATYEQILLATDNYDYFSAGDISMAKEGAKREETKGERETHPLLKQLHYFASFQYKALRKVHTDKIRFVADSLLTEIQCPEKHNNLRQLSRNLFQVCHQNAASCEAKLFYKLLLKGNFNVSLLFNKV